MKEYIDRHRVIDLIRPGRIGIVIASILIIAGAVLAWSTLNSIKEHARKDLQNVLSTTLQTTYEGLKIWMDERSSEASFWAGHPGVQQHVIGLLSGQHDRESLLKHDSLRALRTILEPMIRAEDFNGFFIIAPDDHISLASMRDANVGSQNLLAAQGGLLAKVFKGSIQISMPMISDVPLFDESGKVYKKSPTMFVVAPIYSDNKVVAALALRIYPSRNFSRLAQLGRIGDSGETYVFNEKGRLLTESRFDDQLRDMGLIAQGVQGILNIEVRDPGGNMLLGYRPTQPRPLQPLTLMAATAISGESGANLDGYNDYRGVPVVGVWLWDKTLGFGITTEIDLDEAYDHYVDTQWIVLFALFLAVLIGIIMSAVVGIVHRRAELSMLELTRFPSENPWPVMRSNREGLLTIANNASQPLLEHWACDVGDKLPESYRQTAMEALVSKTSRTVHIACADHCFELVFVPIFKHQYINIYGMDITKTEQAMQSLEASEERYRALVETTPNSVGLHQGGKWVFANPASVKVFGFDYAEEMIGSKVLDRVHPDSHATVIARMQEMAHMGEPMPPVEEKLLRKDGTSFYAEVQTAGVMLESGPAVLVAARDLTLHKKMQTERDNMQRQVEHTQRLESLGVLAGGIAHDFNNLLMAMMGNAALAAKKVGADSVIAPYLHKIELTGKRAAELCKQMLAYAGQGSYSKEPLHLSKLIHEMMDLLQVSIGKNVDVSCQLPDSLSLIDGDLAQMQQVVMNLVINASDAISEQRGSRLQQEGLIEITVEEVSLSQAALATFHHEGAISAGNYIRLTVVDNGCGMDKATQAKIFEPFFTTKFTGRGLGMSAMLGIIRSHDGAIHIDSTSGAGTTMQVVLPISPQQTLLKQEVSETKPALQKPLSGTVLVVDDDDIIRDVAVDILTNAGFDTLVACDGLEALATFKEHHRKIAFVLLDMTMPKMDGEQAFYGIRDIDANASVYISSGYDAVETSQRFQNQQPNGYIQKPYAADALIELATGCCDV
ncbi:MAG: response regulator [Mariprofundaceae bacterium]